MGQDHADIEARYAEFNRRMEQGEPMTEDLWLAHFEHQNLDATSGIEVGEAAPDFELADHTGRRRRRDELAGPAGLLLVFARSSEW